MIGIDSATALSVVSSNEKRSSRKSLRSVGSGSSGLQSPHMIELMESHWTEFLGKEAITKVESYTSQSALTVSQSYNSNSEDAHLPTITEMRNYESQHVTSFNVLDGNLRSIVTSHQIEDNEWKEIAEAMYKRQITFDENPKPWMTYNTFLYTSFFVITILAVLERFYFNWMPDGQLPDIPDNIDDPFRFFHISQRITARAMLCCLSLFFLTMTRVLHNTACEYVPFWLCDMTNYNRDTYLIHRQVGLYLVVLVIFVHVGSAFVPLLDGRKLKITDEAFYPFYIPFRREVPFPKGGDWNMRIDDIYQGIIGILLAIIMPVTIVFRPLRRKYNLSFGLHVFGALVMIWLVYRIPEHVRTFAFLSAPVAFWMIDRVIFMFLYRRKHERITQVLELDEEYSVVCFPAHHDNEEIGDLFYFSCPQKFGFFDFSHPYTTFIQDVEISADTKGLASDADISQSQFETKEFEPKFTGVHSKTISFKSHVSLENVGKQRCICSIVKDYGPETFSSFVTNFSTTPIQIRGPFRRVYSRLEKQPVCKPLVLVATGSGVGYILDFLRWIQEDRIELLDRVLILYSTHSPALLSYVSDILIPMHKRFLESQLHLTDIDFSKVKHNESVEEVQILLGRFDIDKRLSQLPKITEVYFCGAKQVHDKIQSLCSKRGLGFFAEVPYET